MPTLRIKDEQGERTVEIATPTVAIGRATENEVQIHEAESSRRHCQIEQGEWGFKLVDLESRNGTKVNGRTVNQHLLNHGDVIQIGKTSLEFVAPNLRPAPAPVPVTAPIAAGSPAEALAKAGVTGPTAPMVQPPGADDIKIIGSPPAPPRARTGPRRPGSTVQGMSTEERMELQKKLRERSIITGVAVVAGVILAAFALMLAYSFMTAKSPQELQARSDWDQANAIKDQNPSGAIEHLKRIPASVKSLYEPAQALIRELEDKVASSQNSANAELVKAYEEIDHFIKKYPDKYDDHESRLNEFEKKWKDEMPEMYKNWLVDMRRRVRDGRIAKRAETLQDLEESVGKLLKEREFDGALGKIEAKRPTFQTDPAASERIDLLYKKVLDEAQKYWTDRDNEAQALVKEGKKEKAQEIYGEVLESYRHKEFDTLRTAILSRIRALE